MSFRLQAALVLSLLFATTLPAQAQDFLSPGVTTDAGVWARNLQKATPAGGTPQARRQAEQRADAALERKDYPAAIAALEARVGMGEASYENYMNLAAIYAARTPKAPQLQLYAARQ